MTGRWTSRALARDRGFVRRADVSSHALVLEDDAVEAREQRSRIVVSLVENRGDVDWGLIVSLATNLAVAILALTDLLNLVSPLRQLFIGSAILQMLVPLPMLVAIARGRTPNPDAWQRTRTFAPMAIVLAAVVLSVYAAFFHDGRLLPQ